MAKSKRIHKPVPEGGSAQKRFTMVASLLAKIDPVRGEPTVHSLDRHPHDRIWKQEYLQKKFLDSFALISSTSPRGSESAAAVCLEQAGLQGNVLRLARNTQVTQDVVIKLESILHDLEEISQRSKSADK